MINWIADGVTPEMERATAEKFRVWDDAMQRQLLDGDDHQRAYVFQLLEDSTIYAYAFFKNKNGDPLKLYPYQDIIINDPWREILFIAANQIGKSVTLCVKALHFSLTKAGTTVLMTSKTLPQSKDLLREIKRLLQTSSLDYKSVVGDTENKTEIEFLQYVEEPRWNEKLGISELFTVELGKSRIVCVPATEAALGYPADLVLGDEIAFYDNGRDFYYRILKPRTYTTKGQIISFTNPNGQQGIAWELANDPAVHAYRFNFLDCPTNTKDEYDKLQTRLTAEEFDSTVNAVFTNPQGGFLTLKERQMMQEDRDNQIPTVLTAPLYFFFDWAKSRDRTVRACGIPWSQGGELGVYVYELKEYPGGTPYDVIVDDMVNTAKALGYDKIAVVGWDNTGVGRGIEDFMRGIADLGIVCAPVEFSLENKSRIYTMFKLLAERNVRGGSLGIKVPFIRDCDKQLASLRFERSSRGFLQVHHESEKDRDDYPDAIAGLVSLIMQPEFAPVSAIYIEDVGDDIPKDQDAEHRVMNSEERLRKLLEAQNDGEV